MQLRALEPLYKILYTVTVSKDFSSGRLKFPGKSCRQIYGNKRLEKFKRSNGPQNFLVKSFALVKNSSFFS